MPNEYEEQEEKYIPMQRGSKAFRRLLGDIFSMKRESARLIIAVLSTAIAATLYPLSLAFAINGVISGNFDTLYTYAGIFFLLYVVQFFSNRERTVSSTVLAQSVIRSLREKAFENLQYVPVTFFGKVKTGYLISRITNDGETLSEFLTFQLPQVVSGIATVIVSISIMFYYDFNLTLYALIVIPVLMGFTFSLQGKVRRNYLRTRRAIAAITGNLSENINAIRTIKSFNVEKRMEERFDDLNKTNFMANMKASLLASLYGSTIRIIEAVGIAIVLIAGAFQLKAGLASVGILVAFVVYVQEFFEPVVQLSQLYNSYQSSMVGVARIYGIIDFPRQSSWENATQHADFRNGIELRDVSFSYGEDEALRNINVRIRKGEKIGIVGHTGAGKTTMSNLIMKFYSPTEGEILLDGKNINEVNTGEYRRLIAPVLQEPFMFKGSVYDNILFSNPDATKEQIDELAKRFSLGEIFSHLPQGLMTNIGEMGRNLSEGQRQAISILRAFVRNPEILIMDEPTSQIDPYSEKLIIESLSDFLKDKTLILITHRFSMVTLVDKIIVLNEGNIVEQGGFKDLLDSDGVFSHLYSIQYGESNGN
jgi:ATP-binding cassette subfamily B protein